MCISNHYPKSSNGYQRSCHNGASCALLEEGTKYPWCGLKVDGRNTAIHLLLGWVCSHSLMLSIQTFIECRPWVQSCCRFEPPHLPKNTPHQADLLWYPLWDTHMHSPNFKLPWYWHTDNSCTCTCFQLWSSQWCGTYSSLIQLSPRDDANSCFSISIKCMWEVSLWNSVTTMGHCRP